MGDASASHDQFARASFAHTVTEFWRDLNTAFVIQRCVSRERSRNRTLLAARIAFNTLDVLALAVSMVLMTNVFGTLGGWGVADVLLLCGLASFAYGGSLVLMGAFDTYQFYPQMLRSGGLEAELLRPGNHVMTIAATLMQPYRLGRLIMASVVYIIGMMLSDANALLLLAILPYCAGVGITMVTCLWMLDACACIRFGSVNDLTRTLSYNAYTLTVIPLHVFENAARYVMQFGLGLGVAVYMPLSVVLGKGFHYGAWTFPIGLATMSMMVSVVAVIWRRTLRFYESGRASVG